MKGLSVCIAHPASTENPDVRFCFLQDLMNRKIVMKMVLELAMLPDQKNRQFIFLTPLDLSALPIDKQMVKIFKLDNPAR